jgi:hypothetical protein
MDNITPYPATTKMMMDIKEQPIYVAGQDFIPDEKK